MSVHAPPPLVVHRDAALAGQDELVAVIFEHLADQLLIVPESVDTGGVQKGDADFERAPQRLGGLAAVRLPVRL